MSSGSVLETIIHLDRPVFTSREIAAMTGRTGSSVCTSLKGLQARGVITKVYRGVWANTKDPRFNLLAVVPFLAQGHQAYISFLTALHMYGIISQIPTMIYAASTAHSRVIKTDLATYSIHQISPAMFKGFDWHHGERDYLIATPEKALIDSLYLSSRKGKRFRHFPELSFGKEFSFRKAEEWAALIEEPRIRKYVLEKLKEIKRRTSAAN